MTYLADMELRQIIPNPGEVRPDKPYRTPDQRWEEVTKEIYGSSAEPENIRHDYDPDWNHRFWSVQGARGHYELKEIGLWSLVGVLFVAADLGWVFMRIIH